MYNNFKELYGSAVKCGNCRLCENRSTVVFGEGNIKADIMFIGEGPGQVEDETARPFVGPAGQLLTKLLGEAGLSREEVYITNVVKCRPPHNRDPQEDEMNACLPILRNQIALIRPKIIAALGRIAAARILGRDIRITREHGAWEQKKGFYMMAVYHPSYLLRNTESEKDALADIIKIREKLEELKK